MKVSRLILCAAVAGCGSVSVVGAPADGGIKGKDGGGEADSAVDATSDAAADAATADTGSGQPPACSMSFAAYCCGAGLVCEANWNSAIQCFNGATLGGGDILPDCDGFHVVRTDSDLDYSVFTASTGAPAAILRQDWSCMVGPPVFDIDAGCLSFWANIPLGTSVMPCFDAGGAARQDYSCDAAVPADDGSLASDAPFVSDAYPGD
jgi:hypothetical protein